MPRCLLSFVCVRIIYSSSITATSLGQKWQEALQIFYSARAAGALGVLGARAFLSKHLKNLKPSAKTSDLFRLMSNTIYVVVLCFRFAPNESIHVSSHLWCYHFKAQ